MDKETEHNGGLRPKVEEDDLSTDDDPNSSTSEENRHSLIVHSQPSQFSEKESKDVSRLRLLVFIVLFFAAVAVSFTVYQVVWKSQQTEVETQFVGVSGRVIDAFYSIANDKIGPLGSLRVAFTAQARDTNSTWPFVSLTSFQQRAAIVKRLVGGLHVAILTLVQESDRDAWEEYVPKNRQWMRDSLAYQSKVGLELFSLADAVLTSNDNMTSYPILSTNPNPSLPPFPSKGPGPYLPCWQSSPFLSGFTNVDFATNIFFTETSHVLKTGALHVSDFLFSPKNGMDNDVVFDGFLSNDAQKEVKYQGDAFGHIYLPVFKSFNETDREVVAIIFALFQWSIHFKNILSEEENGVVLVLENGCSQPFTYRINGKDVVFLGSGDLHNTKFDHLMRSASFSSLRVLQDGTEYGLKFQYDYCPVQIRLYPSTEFVDSITTNQPIFMAVTVVIVFLFTIMMFLIYDRLVERRQTLVLNKAVQSSAIVSSLFPRSYADRLLEQNNSSQFSVSTSYSSNNKRLKSFLIGDNEANENEQPIADLFPFATVLFADIAGFTAWSSTREPVQVFILLQRLYQAFDALAQKRKVFKVETIGDSYVAVTGVPEPQKQHALIMARFARDIQKVVKQVTLNLGLSLGPDTCDLRMRIGMHSGPVTAGVLRGERARFQLFGDTVNTAARMESTSVPTKIHISSATASLLIQADKTHWVKPRDDAVQIKGKGLLNTYWLVEEFPESSISVESPTDETSSNLERNQFKDSIGSKKRSMLVSWICELLHVHMKKLIATRDSIPLRRKSTNDISITSSKATNPLQEVVEAIVLPEYNGSEKHLDGNDHIEIDKDVKGQLYNLVSTIASLYRGNPFHNFEHACHVTMSVNKLLMRVVTPDVDVENVKGDFASHLHDYTHGINSDPITIFAIIFSAVVHDLDHRGVSNTQLIKEEPPMGKLYNGKSVAEQNSLDIAWELFMTKDYATLRSFLFQTEDEMKRFRQVLVNVVLATDIFDKELNDLRKKRWDKAFSPMTENEGHRDYHNLRATIVIEHIIQASDVAHTMQHWHVYRKWNNRLFEEMYAAYKSGRMGADPSEFWYKGELSFFDNYIIPLAKKLKDCHVFGVSSDEYLIYAEQNRAEWEARGEEIVVQMINEISTSNASGTSILTLL